MINIYINEVVAQYLVTPVDLGCSHYSDVIMSDMAFQITSVLIIYSIVCSGTDQRNHQSSASLAFVWGIHRSPVNSPHKGPVTRKMFPFDDVIIITCVIKQQVRGNDYFLLKFVNMKQTSVILDFIWASNIIFLRVHRVLTEGMIEISIWKT